MGPNDLAHAWYRLRDTHAEQLSNNNTTKWFAKTVSDDRLLKIIYLRMNSVNDIDAVRVKVAVSRLKFNL